MDNVLIVVEERLGGFEIVNNDEDVVHPFKRHILPSLASLLMPEPTKIEPSLGRTSCEYRRAGSERVNARKPLRRLWRVNGRASAAARSAVSAVGRMPCKAFSAMRLVFLRVA